MVEPQITTPVPVAKTGLAALRQAAQQQASGDAGSSGFSTMLQAFDIAFADAARPQPAVAAPANEHAENNATVSAAGDDDSQTEAAPNQRRADKAPSAATAARGTRGGARAPNPAAERSESTSSTDDQAATEAAPESESVGGTPDAGSAAETELLANDAAMANPVTVNLLAGQVMAAPKIAASQKATPLSDAPATSETAATASPAVVPTAVPDTAATTALAGAPEAVPLSGAAAVPLNAAEKAVSVPIAQAATKQQDAVQAETALPPGAPAGISATATLAAVKSMEAPRQPHDAAEQGLNDAHSAALPVTNTAPNPAMPNPAMIAAAASGGKTAEMQAAAAQKAEQLALRGLEAGGRLHGAYGASAATRAAATTQSTPLRAAPVIEQVAVKLNQQAKGGLDQLTIQLRPTDLGRVDIKLSFQDGAVTGTIIADTRTTLDLLVKDQRALERALQDAGLRTESGALSFELRDQSQHSDAQRQAQKNQRGRNGDFTLDVVDAAAADAATMLSDRIISADRVNLRI